MIQEKSEQIIDLLSEPILEHELFKVGKSIIDKNTKTYHPTIADNNYLTQKEKSDFRFHNLVRIGATIENCGLTKFNNASLVGAYQYLAKNEN